MMKNIKRWIPVICMTLVMFAVTAVPALAASKSAAPFYESNMTGTLDSSAFQAGNGIDSDAKVQGVMFQAGNDVNASGRCEYLMQAGNSVTFSGSSEHDGFLAGRTVSQNGTIGRDMFAAAQQINIFGCVQRNVYATASKIVVEGTIGGDLYLSADTIVIRDTAKIGGQLHYNSSAQITTPAALTQTADVYQEDNTETDIHVSVEKVRHDVWGEASDLVISYIGLALIALLLFWLSPLWEIVDEEYTEKTFGTYAKTFGVGFGFMAAVPVAVILLLISRIGVRLAVILGLIYIAMIIAAPIFLGFFLGRLIVRKLMKRESSVWAELLIGLLIWRILSAIPVLGFAAGLITVPFGMGLLVLLFLGSRRRRKERQEMTNSDLIVAEDHGMITVDSVDGE